MAKSKFRQIYDALPEEQRIAPKTEWIKNIAQICLVHPQTVRCWLAGTQTPDALKRSLIAQHLGENVNELF